MAAASLANEHSQPLSTQREIQGASPEQSIDGQVEHFSFLAEVTESMKQVILTAYASRGKLAQDVKTFVVVTSSAVVSMPGRVSKVTRNPKIHALLLEENDPEALAAVMSGSGAALCLGGVGAVVGVTVGGATGLVVGAVPAIFTLGLSLPIGMVVGGAGGLCTGIAVGSGVGFVGGAAAGGTVAYYRIEIRDTANGAVARLDYPYDRLVRQPVLKVKSASKCVCDQTRASADYTQKCAQAFVSSRCTQVTVASAAVGAAALGTAGATGGALAGGAAGMAIGLVPALFTFGLSIPVGAVIGGGIGLCGGAATGGCAGLAGGASLGYGGYKLRGKPAQALTLARKMIASRGTLRVRGSSGGTEDMSSD